MKLTISWIMLNLNWRVWKHISSNRSALSQPSANCFLITYLRQSSYPTWEYLLFQFTAQFRQANSISKLNAWNSTYF